MENVIDVKNHNAPLCLPCPTISVIIPIYNAEKYIAECLDSLLVQTFQDFEVIVVDDYSTDNSFKIVESYVEKFNGRLLLTKTEKNSDSEAIPRNKGILLSRGEYVQFVNADDMISTTALEELYALSKEYSADLVYVEKHYSGSDMDNVSIRGRHANIILYGEKKDFRKRLSEQKSINRYTQIINKFSRYFTARMDIKLMKTEGDFKILSLSDDKANLRKPEWFQKNGIGYVLTSYVGNVEFIAKATVDGQISLWLRGLNVHDPEDKSKRIPYWIDYTRLSINGNEIFNELTPAWHDKPYHYNMKVKAGEEVKIQVEWLPHRSDT